MQLSRPLTHNEVLIKKCSIISWYHRYRLREASDIVEPLSFQTF